MEDSKIEWTDHTHNPWIGCTRVSEACQRCYAEYLAETRFGWATWGPGQPRVRTSEDNRRKPLSWNRKAAREGRRAKVFCASLADVFDDEVDQAWRDDLWKVIRACPNLDWQLLTKRPEHIRGMLPKDWGDGWPNVWLGVTAETQRRADERLPILLQIPAVVHFASCEPLLESLDLTAYLGNGLNWVITGGETGDGARRMMPSWAQGLRDQCVSSGVAFHFKQWGDVDACGTDVGKKAAGRMLDGRTWDEFPATAAPVPRAPVPLPVARAAPSPPPSPTPRDSAPVPITAAQRRRIVRLVGAGESSTEIATRVGVSVQQAAAIRAHITMGTYESTG